MEVPRAVLQNLVCDYCGRRLSCGLISMLDYATSLSRDANRDNIYEELVTLVTFPCAYKENGCDEKIRLVDYQEHEEICAFKLILCPNSESDHCYWSDTCEGILEHCRLKHPDSVIENPAELKHDLTKSNRCNYILSAFHTIFLVQMEVCTVTKKIYYSVRLLSNPCFPLRYMYDVTISNKVAKFIKHGTVALPRCLALQTDTSVAVNIDGLLALLGDLKDTIFEITLRSMDAEMENTTKEQDDEAEKGEADI